MLPIVTEADEGGSGGNPSGAPRTDHKRALVGLAFLGLVLAGAGVAIFDERHSFATSISRIGPVPVFVSLGFGLLGVGAGFPVWHEILDGLGARLPWADAGRVLFVSQLGKYLPGSVWPLFVQMEAGRSRGINRRTMIAANLLTIALSCGVGLVVACVVLPFYDSHALARYWWALLVLPLLLAILHPRTLPAVLDRVFAVLRRPPLMERLDPWASFRACLWSVLSWIGYGAQLAVLAFAVGPSGFSTLVLCIGAVSLAIPLGVLFIPAPAGAGVREVILVLVLTTILSTGQALAIVLASRAILIGCDLSLAAGAALVGWSRGRKPSPTSWGEIGETP